MVKGSFINPYKMFVGNFVPNWLACRPEVSDGAKLTYARLCRFAGKDGNCYPSLEILALELGKSVSSVCRHLRELKELALIKAERKGLGQNNNYLFLYNDWMNQNPVISDLSDMDNQDLPDMNNQDLSDMASQELSDMANHSIKENHSNYNHNKNLSPKKSLAIEVANNLPESCKIDYIEEIIRVFRTLYLTHKKNEYISVGVKGQSAGKDRKAVSQLLKAIKILCPNDDSKQIMQRFINLFTICFSIKDPWLSKNMTLPIINSKLNEIIQYAKNERDNGGESDRFFKGFDIGKSSWATKPLRV